MLCYFIFNNKILAYLNLIFEKYRGKHAPYKAICTLHFIIIP